LKEKCIFGIFVMIDFYLEEMRIFLIKDESNLFEIGL